MSGQEEDLKKVKVAKVVSTHGVRGEVKAIPLSDFPDRYSSLERVYVERNKSYHEIKVASVRWNKRHLLIKFEGIETPEQAALLKDKYLMIDVEDTVPLPEGSYYLFEIIGLEAVDIMGNPLGTIQDILQTAANDVYVVKKKDEKEILIPALKKVVKQVDLENKTMVVDLPEGLVEGEV